MQETSGCADYDDDQPETKQKSARRPKGVQVLCMTHGAGMLLQIDKHKKTLTDHCFVLCRRHVGRHDSCLCQAQAAQHARPDKVPHTLSMCILHAKEVRPQDKKYHVRG
jgi:hypothetical protein